MASASAEQRDLETLYPRIERASAALVFHVGGVGEPTLYSRASAGNRLLAERGGRLGFAFTEYPISPLVIPRGEQWNEAVVRLYTAPTSLRPKTDMNRFRYLLIHVSDEGLRDVLRRSLAPDATLVAIAGDWSLFASAHTVVPITTPADARLEPPSETLRDRIFATARGQE